MIHQAGRSAYSVMSFGASGEWRRVSPAALESIESAHGPLAFDPPVIKPGGARRRHLPVKADVR